MHAFLLINSDPKEFVKKQNADILPFVLQKVEDARDLKKVTKFKFSKKTAIVIENIDTATNETLNAFLKNLEEPNENLIYVLTASNLDNVLPTIVSRCEVLKSTNTNKRVVDEKVYEKFLNLSEVSKLDYVSKIKDRGEAIKFIEDLIFLDHKNMNRNSHDKNFKNMENYLNTLKNLKVNGNVSLQLANFVVTMNPAYGR